MFCQANGLQHAGGCLLRQVSLAAAAMCWLLGFVEHFSHFWILWLITRKVPADIYSGKSARCDGLLWQADWDAHNAEHIKALSDWFCMGVMSRETCCSTMQVPPPPPPPHPLPIHVYLSSRQLCSAGAVCGLCAERLASPRHAHQGCI